MKPIARRRIKKGVLVFLKSSNQKKKNVIAYVVFELTSYNVTV